MPEEKLTGAQRVIQAWNKGDYESYRPSSIEEIRAARERIDDVVVRTPLVRLEVDDAPADVYLKLENLQLLGSFKLRGVMNIIRQADPEQLAKGVWTVSTGNMARAVAWGARELGVDCTVVVSDHAPAAKLAAITRLGAKIVKAPRTELMEVYLDRSHPAVEGLFFVFNGDPLMMAGNATIGLEILEDLPDVNAVVIPWGAGALSCGIASALRALRPDVKAYASEIETGAPLAPSLAAGKPVEVSYTPSFVDGISGPLVFPEMLALASHLLDGSLISTLDETASAIRVVAERNHVVSEGAGGTSVAAALAGKAGGGKVVSVVSGGNIDSDKLAKILLGETP